jgi:hypothetical protein
VTALIQQLVLLQISNLTSACGNAGDPSRLRLTWWQQPAWFYSGNPSNMQVQFGDVSFANVYIPGSGTSWISASNNAAVSPTSQSVNQWRQVILDIPCNRIVSSKLSFVHIATATKATDQKINDIQIRSCLLETCGGQGITCPGLNASKACTPGYDCMLSNLLSCTMFEMWNHKLDTPHTTLS